MPALELFYDVASPYSYLASRQVEAIAADTKATLVWRPFLLGAVFKATGNDMPARVPARARYMLKDLERWARYYGAPFSFPANFPPNSLTAMRVLASAEPAEIAALTHALYQAQWVENRDIAQEAVLREVVGDAAFERASSPTAKERLRANTDEAVARGAFGAPTIFVGDEMFFGNDRLPFVEQALRDAGGR